MGLSSTLIKAAVKVAGMLTGNKALLVVIKSLPVLLPVQFNPSEYRITEQTSYTEQTRRKKDEPVMNFNGRPLSVLSVKLYFDGDDLMDGDGGSDISGKIAKISALTVIDGESHQPPGVLFVWGSLLFIGHADNVGVTYTMFDKSGMPLRAVVDLTIKGTNGLSLEKISPFLSPDRTKARTMTEDNNIWNMAQNEYGDLREWRRIADANGIMNPLDIPVGTILKVPSIDD